MTWSSSPAKLDVPAEKIKGAKLEMAHQWTRELVLPFKVRVEVSEWLYRLLAPSQHRKRQAYEGSPESDSKRRKEEGGDPEVAGTLCWHPTVACRWWMNKGIKRLQNMMMPPYPSACGMSM